MRIAAYLCAVTGLVLGLAALALGAHGAIGLVSLAAILVSGLNLGWLVATEE